MSEVLINRSYNDVRKNDDGTHDFLISDESIDTHRTIFVQSGADFTRFERNPIVTAGHPDINSSDPDLVIGRGEIIQEGNKTFAKVYYDEENPLAMKYKSKVERGFIKMTSTRTLIKEVVRSMPGDPKDVVRYNKWELLDFGIMMHGSNKNAMKRSEERELVVRSFNLGDEEPPEVKVDDIKEYVEVGDEIKERLINILKKKE